MPSFRFQAYDADGSRVEGVIEAASDSEALQLLSKRGLLPYEATLDTNAAQRRPHSYRLFARDALSTRDYADLAHELSTLLQSGLSLDDCLRLTSSQAGNKRIARVAQSLLNDVVAGQSLSQSLERLSAKVPTVLTSMLRAGEARGDLATAMADAGSLLSKREELRAQLRSAMTYPIVLAVTAAFALLVVLVVLVPALKPIFDDTGVPLPFVIAAGHGLSVFVTERFHLLVLVLVTMAVIAWFVSRQPQAKMALDALLLRLPLFGSLLRKSAIAAYARTLGILLLSGVTLISAMRISASVVTNRKIASALREAVEPVQEGERLAAVLQQSGQVPETALRFIAIGEQSSRLDKMLVHLADLYDKEIKRQQDKVMTILSPAITIVLGVSVGALILSVMQAILSINDLALR